MVVTTTDDLILQVSFHVVIKHFQDLNLKRESGKDDNKPNYNEITHRFACFSKYNQ